MKNLLAVTSLVLFACLLAAGFFLGADNAEAGRRSVKMSFDNVTVSQTQSISLDKVNGWTADVNMRNYTGSFGLQRSYDGGATYLAYTTMHTAGGRLRFNETSGDKPTHLRGVLTSAFGAVTSFVAHVNKGVKIFITVDEDWR